MHSVQMASISGRSSSVFFVGVLVARFFALHRQGVSILDDPLDGFTLLELHGVSECRGEVDVPLLAGFAFDQLDFCRVTHG